jgi:alpha-1,3/alpha-1,6-mannosyltransferase
LESLVPGEWEHLKLVIAGGYDTRVKENVDHYDELSHLAKQLNIDSKVTFLKSPPEATKIALIRTCVALVYTPENEHFGIVPLEAMYLGAPVIAMDSGGPKETVVNGVTGYLTPPGDAGAVAKAMVDVLTNPHRVQMGTRGKERVKSRFSFESFGEALHSLVMNLVEP